MNGMIAWAYAGAVRGMSTGMAALLLVGFTSALAAETSTDQAEPIDPEDIPSVHNTFYQVPEGTVSWDVLGTMDVEVEVIAPLQTQMTRSFTDEVKELDDQTVQIMGFLYPLKGGLAHERFLLTAWPPSCPFCLPAGPTLMVEVLAADPVEFSEGAILMAGRFDLLENDPSGLYYRLKEATLVERFDDIRWTGQGLNDQGLPR
ncbi:MAG: hypothetical protein ACR2P3_13840 [Geminicoccaceae bacterium]